MSNIERLALGSNCPSCGSNSDEECRTPAGRTTTPHKARIDRAVSQYLASKTS